LKVVSVVDGYEQTFWDYVNRDPLNYCFFIFDWRQNRDKTRILLAMEGKKVEGSMLVYCDYIVQLRGSRETVKLLLDRLSLTSVELQAPLDCEDLVLVKFRPKIREEMILMRLRRGEERIRITTVPTKLGAEDVEEIADLMRTADPGWWGEVTAERIRSRIGDAFWLGIKQDGRIVSVGATRLTDFGSNIHVAATKEQHRNRGYATSIVSALVKEILKTSSIALIHVISDNAPAIRAYSKVGFKPYKTYLSIRN